MATVEIVTMPRSYLKIPERFRPGHPPIFIGGNITEADYDLARELFKALDEESQKWYTRSGCSWLFENPKKSKKQPAIKQAR
jgi:hypothetical protein